MKKKENIDSQMGHTKKTFRLSKRDVFSVNSELNVFLEGAGNYWKLAQA